MPIFTKSKAKSPPPAPQLRAAALHPFAPLRGYSPGARENEIPLYRSIREAVPIVDAALLKIIRLTGGCEATGPCAAATEGLRRFLREVPVGRGRRGLEAFLESYLDSMLTCGMAVGETVVDLERREITALICGDASALAISEGGSPLDFTLGYRDGARFVPYPAQELLLFTPYNPEPENPYGVSLLRSMPFMADILLKIYRTIGANWERVGNARFAVVMKPGADPADRAMAAERAAQVARQWSEAMSGPEGQISDFVAVGDVDIRVIGADNQILDSSVPVRQILEQLIARTGIPPFLLGLNWSTTERMSAQQADLMTSELAALRRQLAPVIERVCELWLVLHGYRPQCELDWQAVNLQDMVQEARAGLMEAQREKILRS